MLYSKFDFLILLMSRKSSQNLPEIFCDTCCILTSMMWLMNPCNTENQTTHKHAWIYRRKQDLVLRWYLAKA